MLIVHRAERADRLVAALADVLSAAPQNPFDREIIAVPSRGVERWVAQQLALSLGAAGRDDGVAANIEFPSPAALVAEVSATVSQLDPERDPWRGTRFVWALLDVIDGCVTESWAAPLAHHLGVSGQNAGQRQGRRFATAALLARLFASYADDRPDMLVDWAAGDGTDGAGEKLRDDLAWQPSLWRRTRELIGVLSPAERLKQVCGQLRKNPGLVALPQRLSVFGATRLSTTELAVLDALAAGRELHLWLTHPSPAMWDKLTATEQALRRRSDNAALNVVNPLLVNLSRDIRELQRRLPTPGADTYYSGMQVRTVSVLTRMQDDIAADRAPGSGGEQIPLDDSVTVHACHGTARQVEVLRESLLRLLDDDPSLQPRDILVLCPNIDDVAPLMAAAFAPISGGHPGHRLRVRLADRRPGAANPLLDVVAMLLELADGRLPASDVLDLAAAAPVALRFGFGESELETLREWAFDAGARWGLDEVQRQRFGLAGMRQNTFAQARDRILVGALADDSAHQWLGSALPLAEVNSSDIDLAGRFAEYLDRLHAVVASATGSHTADGWAQVLRGVLDELTAAPAAEGWQRTQAGALISEALSGASGRPLELAEVRDALAGVLAARPTRANFRTGEITVATLVPMRFVPHRVVAVIGLDDGVFPRVGHLSGDDVLGVDPCVGERDPRSEDRQLLLDALMSAQDRVILCYTGADPVSGESRPPAAPLADVIDTLAATVAGDPKTVVRHQPLQPFDPANFAAPQPFSFDADAFAGATAAAGPRQAAPPFLDSPLPLPAGEVELDELVDFATHPVKAFLRQRMGIALSGKDTARPDTLPLELDGLQRWQIGDRLLAAAQADPGTAVADFAAAERRRGVLPPGPSGQAQLDDIASRVQVLARAFHDLVGDRHADTVDVTAEVGDWQLSGTVAGLYGDQLVSVSYSKLEPKHRLRPWVRLLVLAAGGYPVRRAVTIGRYKDLQVAFYAVHTTPQDPAEALAALLELRAAGMCQPLPLFSATSHAYVAAGVGGYDGVRAATEAWEGGFNRPGENADAAMMAVHGTDCPFSTVWDLPIPEGHTWSAEPTWFGQLAQRMWAPVIAAESIGNTL